MITVCSGVFIVKVLHRVVSLCFYELLPFIDDTTAKRGGALTSGVGLVVERRGSILTQVAVLYP